MYVVARVSFVLGRVSLPRLNTGCAFNLHVDRIKLLILPEARSYMQHMNLIYAWIFHDLPHLSVKCCHISYNTHS